MADIHVQLVCNDKALSQILFSYSAINITINCMKIAENYYIVVRNKINFLSDYCSVMKRK